MNFTVSGNLPAWVQAGASIATFLTTVVLAYLTYRLAIETRRLADESERQRRPVLVGRLEPLGALHVEYVITNVSTAFARNVTMQLTLTGETTSWRHVVFEPGRSEFFRLPGPDSPLPTLADDNATLEAMLRYEDSTGNMYSADDRFAFASLRGDWLLARWQTRPSGLESVRTAIHEGLREVAKQIGLLKSDHGHGGKSANA